MVFSLMFVLQIVLPECCDVLCVVVKCCTFEHALFLYDQVNCFKESCAEGRQDTTL